MDRWATFDCYGTLVDWQTGIEGQLARLFGEGEAARLLARYHDLEPKVQRGENGLRYREVLSRTLGLLAAEEGVHLPAAELDALGRSLPEWPVFPDVPGALAEARGRGWRLAILSNSDRDLIEASIAAIGVPVDHAVVAGEIGSYKPAFRHWEVFADETGARPERHVHVAQSRFHDVEPARALGLSSIWINRLGERGHQLASRELPDLADLVDVLEELVPA